jgi:hypothetical protein
MSAAQGFCSRCGKQAGKAPLYPPAQTGAARHIRVAGMLWLGLSAFRLLPGILLLAASPFWMEFVPPEVRPMLFGMVGVLGTLFLIGALLGFAAGWGLLERKPWARTLTIALSVLSLFDVPLGTALGIYTLWVLLPARTEAEFLSAAQMEAPVVTSAPGPEPRTGL